MFVTYAKLCETTISVATNWNVYHDFINLYLRNFVSSPVEKPDLRIHSLFPTSSEDYLGLSPFSRENMRKVGRDVYFDAHKVYYQQENRNVFVQFDEDDSILIYCEDQMRLRKRGSLRTAIKNAMRAALPQSHPEVCAAFQTHMRLTFHFPLFWMMEAHRGCHLLHATAVRINGSGIIFSGLASAGKTTLATFLYCNHPGTHILTDNFLLYDREFIYAFPEASRLSSQGIEIAAAQSLLDHAFILGHRYHWVPQKPDPFNTVPKKAFLVCLGNDLRVEPISAEFFADTALGLNDVAKEFHNYSYVGLFPFATRRSFDIYASRACALKSCLQNVDCTLLSIPKVPSLMDIRQDILDIVLPTTN